MNGFWVMVLECKIGNSFIVHHVEYDSVLIQTFPEYAFLQNMLKSSKRMNVATFLPIMMEKGWEIAAQSQHGNSLFYTLVHGPQN